MGVDENGNDGSAPTKALATRSEEDTAALRADPRAFEPADIRQAQWIAAQLARSGLVAKALTNKPEAIFGVIVLGRELGLTVWQSLRSIYVVDGRATMSAALIVGLCLSRRDVCAYLSPVETTAERCTYAAKRVGGPEARFSFSLADAARAGLTGKDVWQKYPAAMLLARAGTMAARAMFPDLASGLYDPSEIELEERDVTPRPAEGEAKTESAALSTIKRKLASAQTPAPQTPAAKTTPAPQTTPAPTEEEIP